MEEWKEEEEMVSERRKGEGTVEKWRQQWRGMG